MTGKSNTKPHSWPDGTNLILGAFLCVSPWFALGGSMAITWNAVILGATIAIVAWCAMVKPSASLEWTNACLGAWLWIAPWALGFSGHAGAVWTSLFVGILVSCFAGKQIMFLKRAAASQVSFRMP